MKKILLAALAFVSIFSVASLSAETGASSKGRDMAAQGKNVFVVAVTQNLTAAQVQKAVVAALKDREWTIDSQEDGKVVAELNAVQKRHMFGHLTITYDAKTVTIKDESTDENGVPKVAIRWVKYYQQSLLTELSNVEATSK